MADIPLNPSPTIAYLAGIAKNLLYVYYMKWEKFVKITLGRSLSPLVYIRADVR